MKKPLAVLAMLAGAVAINLLLWYFRSDDLVVRIFAEFIGICAIIGLIVWLNAVSRK